MFLSSSGSPSAGTFEAGGVAAYLDSGSNNIAAPAQTKVDPYVLGGYAGAGGGVFITKAQSASQLEGPFAQWNADIGLEGKASLSLAYSNGIWIFSVTVGSGYGVAGSALTTTTATQNVAGTSCQ
ncbi:MAG TPA: hypothetical protein VG204_20235 [Terriglobia bacterium]|nr:hypothetical protein [Terriglobia bacterium]